MGEVSKTSGIANGHCFTVKKYFTSLQVRYCRKFDYFMKYGLMVGVRGRGTLQAEEFECPVFC